MMPTQTIKTSVSATGSPSARPAWQRNLPNALTIARVFLAIVFFVLLSIQLNNDDLGSAFYPIRGVNFLLIAAGVFIIAALTDALDGYLARRWNVVSVFGRIMDPFADKILILGAFVFLSALGRVPSIQMVPIGADPDLHSPFPSFIQPWMVIVILARELLITSLRAAVEAKGVSFAATLSGKLKMILQSICVPVVLIYLGIPGSMLDICFTPDTYATFVQWLVWITVVVTVWSALPYCFRAYKVLQPAQGSSGY